MIFKRIGLISAWTLGMVLCLGSIPSAKAEYFEFTSTVSIDSTPGTYTPSASTITNAPSGLSGTFLTPNGNQVILSALSSNPGIPRNNATGFGTDIVPLNVNANSAFGSETIGMNFTLTLTMTDYAGPLDLNPSAPSVNFVFEGRIGGQLGNYQTNLSLLSFVPSQVSGVVGTDEYTISLNNFSSPGTDSDGRLSLHVTSRAVPEPGSIALLGIGGTLGLYLRRRNKASV